MRIAPLEAEQSTLRELSATRQEVMAYQRVTSQRVEDIQSDLEVNTEKFISFEKGLDSQLAQFLYDFISRIYNNRRL